MVGSEFNTVSELYVARDKGTIRCLRKHEVGIIVNTDILAYVDNRLVINRQNHYIGEYLISCIHEPIHVKEIPWLVFMTKNARQTNDPELSVYSRGLKVVS